MGPGAEAHELRDTYELLGARARLHEDAKGGLAWRIVSSGGRTSKRSWELRPTSCAMVSRSLVPTNGLLVSDLSPRKLDDARVQVAEMSVDLEEKQKICDVKAKECEELLKATSHRHRAHSTGDYSRALQSRRSAGSGGVRLHPH